MGVRFAWEPLPPMPWQLPNRVVQEGPPVVTPTTPAYLTWGERRRKRQHEQDERDMKDLEMILKFLSERNR
jgi:hypothetical protein